MKQNAFSKVLPNLRQMIKAAIGMMIVVGLAACTVRESGDDPDGIFGTAVTDNDRVMINGQNFAVDMTRKFASEAPNLVHFAFGSAQLDATAQTRLRVQARWIKTYPHVRFRVFGHTDLVGTSAYNRALGLRRAQAAVAYLISQGVDRSQVDAVVSEGKTQPLVMTQGPSSENRRTVTEVLGMMRPPGQDLDGKYAHHVYKGYLDSAQPAALTTVRNQTSAGESVSGN